MTIAETIWVSLTVLGLGALLVIGGAVTKDEGPQLVGAIVVFAALVLLLFRGCNCA